MPDMKLPSYFYGDEAMQFTYFRIPCQLITHPRFKHLSTDSKLLYGMLLDRMSLSIKNEWYDDTGRVYIYYTVDEIGSNLNCGRDKAMKLLAEIDSMSQTTTKINNIRAYLLTALYNAPITIGPYYSAAVRHDFG